MPEFYFFVQTFLYQHAEKTTPLWENILKFFKESGRNILCYWFHDILPYSNLPFANLPFIILSYIPIYL